MSGGSGELAWRIPALVAFLLGGIVYDRWRHGREGRRAREYGFLLACGALGGLAGVAQDQLSLQVCPAFFVYAKGIRPGPNFTWRASAVGLHAGLFAGFLAAGLLLLLNQPRPARAELSLWRVARSASARILGLAALGVPAGYLFGPELPLRDFLADYRGDPVPFLRVWGMHIGLYAGAVVGLGWALIGTWRARPRTSPPSESGAESTPAALPSGESPPS